MGKIALVTGATSGIGEAVAVLLAKEGTGSLLQAVGQTGLRLLPLRLKMNMG